MHDPEKACPEGKSIPEFDDSLNAPDEGPAEMVDVSDNWRSKAMKMVGFGGFELRGAVPISIDERTNTSFLDIGTLRFCMNANMLPITFGMLGPSYGLSLRDSSLVIMFFTLLTALLPAYMSTLGPKTGMRQMIQARFSYGKWIVSIPILLNLATLTGFCIIMAVIGGQCLSAVSGGTLSPAVGIVIVSILCLLISFSGFKVLHLYEKWAWVPSVIALIIAVGCGGKHLHEQATPEKSATAGQILSFAMIVASYTMPWSCLASDFSTYMVPTAPSSRIFLYSYAGLSVPTILGMVLGAAIGGAVPNVPAWEEKYNQSLVGGALAGMLMPAGGFGKFVLVILSFSLLGNMSATSYSITLNFQMFLPWLLKVPRFIFSIVITALVLPISIKASSDFFLNLENFIALIGYWSSSFVGVFMVEHFWFRRADCSTYTHEAWNDSKSLPLGIAAITASVLSFGLVIPTMEQVWWVGPIAKTTGDLGFEVAFFLSGLLYVPFRVLEKHLSGR